MTDKLQTIETDYDQLYVFNSESANAFIIISANDMTESVLGYSTESCITSGSIPPQMSYWLNEINRQVKAVANGWGCASKTRGEDHEAIAPMITSRWDQSAPYNLRVATSSNQYVTGCVATAMAQIMYYHKWPEEVTERIPSPGAALIDLEPTTFNWSQMRDNYSSNDTDDGAQEVAKLMAYCGYAAKMDYDMGSSGAQEDDAAEGMRRYMGYDKTTEVVYRASYTSDQWDEIIYQELAAKRPVLYCGFSAGGGHAFVCDGYDGNGYYHINWGWGGHSDAYFLLSILNPDDQGIGGTPGSDGYSVWQSAIIGIQKAETPYDPRRLVTSRIFTQTNDIERSSGDENFSLKVYSYLTNRIEPAQSVTIDTAFGLFKEDTLIDIFEGSINKNVNSGSFISTSKTIEFGKDLADGVYQIRALHRISESSEWIYPHMAKAIYLDLQIDGTRLIATERNAASYGSAKLLTDMDVLSASINGTAYAKHAVEVIANIKNSGSHNIGILDMEVARMPDYSDAATISRVGVNIDPGKTDNVAIHFTPRETGDYYIRLINFANDSVLKELSVNVETAPAVILQCTELKVDSIKLKEGYNNYYDVVGDSIKLNLQVQNLGPTTYKNYFYVFIFGKSPEDSSWPSSSTYKTTFASIEPGETKSFYFKFENLIPDKQYTFTALYMDGDERYRFSDISYGIYLVSDATNIVNIKSDNQKKNIYNLQGRYMGTNLNALPKGIYIIGGKKVVK